MSGDVLPTVSTFSSLPHILYIYIVVAEKVCVHGWLFNLPKISQEKPNAIMTDNQLADKVISGEFLALLLDLLFC
jgi:hypothetical protein